MVPRPDIFDKTALELWLNGNGCTEKAIPPVVSELRLVIALVLRATSEEVMRLLLKDLRKRAGLADLESIDAIGAYAIEAIKRWSEQELDRYVQERARYVQQRAAGEADEE
jgi:hypothetical protein